MSDLSRWDGTLADRNLTVEHESTSTLSTDERRAALSYLLGAVSGWVPADAWDDALRRAVEAAR